MVANLQYGWTLFVSPIDSKHHWGRAAIQVAFSIFVLLETWLVPIEGYLVDRFGPRPVVLVGGVLCGLAWTLNSFADTLSVLYIAAALGGVGAGAVYGTCVGNALKWFPDRRGLAAGLTAAGFGAGSALTIVPISAMIKTHGYEQAFLYFGLGQAKGTASLPVPLANILAARTGGWHSVFVIAAVMNAVAALMALIVLMPKRKKFLGTVAAAEPPRTGRLVGNAP
jgi:MFS family permease